MRTPPPRTRTNSMAFWLRHQHDKMICHNHDHWSKNISSCDPSGNTTIHYFLNATTRTINTSLSRRKYIPMDQYVVILVQFSIVIHSRSWFPLPTDKTYKSIGLSSQQLKFIYCPAYSLHPLFSSPKMHYIKKRFFITSNLRYRVLTINQIKN